MFEAFVKAHRATWTNAESLRQWQDTLPDFCEPIADMAIADVGVDDVLRVLEPRWHEIPTTMGRVRSRIESVLGYAMAKKLRPRGPNPGAWRENLKHLLASPTKLAEAKKVAEGKVGPLPGDAVSAGPRPDDQARRDHGQHGGAGMPV